MSSDYKDEKNKLNSYSLLINWRGLHAMGLSVADWNSLQHAGTCYSRSENLRCRDRNSTLLSWWKDAKMQSELDTVGCHWQDMLLPHYIQVSHVTVWPTTGHYLKNSMYLEDDYYGTFNTIMGDLDTLISLLQPGVEEIARQCGSQLVRNLAKASHHCLANSVICNPMP